MRVVFLDASTIGATNLERFCEFGEFITYETTKPSETAQRIEDADIVLTNKVRIGENELKHAKNLKLICVVATGTNNIDFDACNARNIAVKNSTDYSTPSVAQIAFSSILSFVSQISYFDNFVKCGDYAKSEIFTDMGREFGEIAGKRFCVVGLGNIGRKVYEIASAFGCDTCYYSTSGENSSAGYDRVAFEEMLACDIISIHCGLNDKTRNLFDEMAISRMKSSAILANFGRGGIVNEKSVATALDNNQIAGYITDVFEAEPINSDSPLLSVRDKNKVLFTPHIAWASREARARLMEKVYENIKKPLI